MRDRLAVIAESRGTSYSSPGSGVR
ncbi:hypothetical protein ACFVGY_31770 [Streptomyces sp. NPDC127106]